MINVVCRIDAERSCKSVRDNEQKIGCANVQEKRPESLHSQFLHILSAHFYKMTSDGSRLYLMILDDRDAERPVTLGGRTGRNLVCPIVGGRTAQELFE